MLGHKALELGDELAVFSELQIGLDPVLEGGHAKFLEPDDLGLREGFPDKICKGGATPDFECGPQDLGCGRSVAGRKRRASLLTEPDECEQVDRVRLDDEPVARRSRLERPVRQQLSQLRNVNLDCVARSVELSI